MPADLFVSYARTDRDRVLPWVRRLQQAGVSLWIDQAGIHAAHLWSQEIVAAIDASKVLLLLLSPAASASEQVGREVSLAVEGKKRLLPLLLEPVSPPPALRYALAGLQYLELFRGEREETFRALLRALARLGIAFEADPDRPPPIPHNLPVALSRFIGRRREIPAVKQQLATTRLLTLTGAGGCGKTRLALQVADDLLWEYPEGVWLVELGSLMDEALVAQEVAHAVGVPEEPGRKLEETLAEALRARRLLLVLDNCEHLVGACAALAQHLLEACPGLQILATSREALGLPGETQFRVPSLAYPDPERLPGTEEARVAELTQYEAVELLLDRVQSSRSGFALTAANSPAVASICQRLDGIPLAIELAAARVLLLSIEQIAARLDDRFRLLTGGSRTALPRQQTLRAAIDWSYDLLTEGERALLRRLSVFAGGFSLEAAEVVCGSEATDGYAVLDRLAQLAEKSLVQVDEPGSESRYRLLETIREYGAEKLRAAGEEAALRERHRDWSLGLAEQAEPELTGRAQGEWLARLEAEHENLRAALAGCTEGGDGEAGLRLGGALWRFWEVRGYLGEGRERLAGVLALPGAAARTAARGRALNGAGVLAYRQGDYEAARALFQESLAIRRPLGDQQGIAASLNNLGLIDSDQGDYEAARALYEESLAIRRPLGDQQGIASSLNNLGNVACYQGDYEAARGLFEECLAIQRRLGDQHAIADLLNNLGIVASDQGEYAAARALHEESLAIRRQLGDQQGTAFALHNLGLLARDQGEYEPARALYEESLVICRQLGERYVTVYNLEGLAAAAGAQGQPEHAARLFGAAEALREAIGAPLPPSDRADFDRHVAAVRAALGEEAFAAAWAEGRALTLEQAITLALAPAEPPAPPPTSM